MDCEYCRDGVPLTKLKRQYIHRIGFRNFVCKEAGFQTEPDTWTDHSPREWSPRRLRKKE